VVEDAAHGARSAESAPKSARRPECEESQCQPRRRWRETRDLVPDDRRARAVGRSAWTFAKKPRYLSDSVFNFTDLPARLLFRIGSLGTLASVLGAAVILIAELTSRITVPGYTATALIVVFFGALTVSDSASSEVTLAVYPCLRGPAGQTFRGRVCGGCRDPCSPS
jgi:hypothetical protein